MRSNSGVTRLLTGLPAKRIERGFCTHMQIKANIQRTSPYPNGFQANEQAAASLGGIRPVDDAKPK